MTDELVEALCGFAVDLAYDDLPRSTLEAATLRLFDTIVVGLRSRGAPPVERLLTYAATKRGGDDVPILGTQLTASLEYAAFANASMIRYLDWNDTYLAAEAAHPSGNVGAVLAAGAATGRPGRDLLLATVLAYEVQCRLCDLAAFTEVGLDHVNWGLVSVPLAVGRLLGLSEAELREAVSIALVGHLGTLQARQVPLSAWKGFAFGNAARNGVVAVELAAAGVEGPAAPITGRDGIGNLVAGDLAASELALGDGFKIEQTHLKRYPICHHALAGVDAVVEIAESADLDPADVRSIDVDTYEVAVRTTAGEGKWRPTTRGTADHSLPYCLARVLIDGTIGPDDLAGDALSEPAVIELMDAVSVHHEPAYTERYGDTFTHAVSVEADGETYERRIDYPLGHVENPLPPAAIAAKVLDTGAADSASVAGLREAVSGLEDASDVGRLLDAAATVGSRG